MSVYFVLDKKNPAVFLGYGKDFFLFLNRLQIRHSFFYLFLLT